MIAVMANEQINSAHIIIQISFEKGHFAACPIQYTIIPNMVTMVIAIDTQGSWQISLVSLVLGISKADMASVPGNLCKVMAATSVCSFLCLPGHIIKRLSRRTYKVKTYMEESMLETENS